MSEIVEVGSRNLHPWTGDVGLEVERNAGFPVRCSINISFRYDDRVKNTFEEAILGNYIVKTALNPRSSQKLQYEGRGEIFGLNVAGCFGVLSKLKLPA